VQSDAVNESEVCDPPPNKVTKMSTGASRIGHLLESKKKEYGAQEKASSKAIEVSYLKFD